VLLGGAAWWFTRGWFGGTSKRPAPAPTVAAPVDPGPDDPPAGDPLDQLFVRGAVRLPAPLAKLPLDGSLADARRAAPEFFAGDDFDVTAPRWPGVVFTADVVLDQAGRAQAYEGPSVYVPMAGEVVDELLAAAWGPGLAAVDGFGKPVVVWFNPADGIRAVLDGSTVVFRRYIPVARLLGEGRDLAFLTAPILGQTPAQVVAAYVPRATLKYDLPDLRLPPTEWEMNFEQTVASPATVDGRIVALEVRLSYVAHRAARDQLLALFRRKWGAGEPVEDGVRYVAGPMEVIVEDGGDAWILSLRDRDALAAMRADRPGVPLGTR